MQVIRKSSFTAIPWRNGAGITHEAIRVPGIGPTFQWRLSVAQIEESGPFSDFSGYHRTMVLLRGNGVRLTLGSREACLREAGDLVEFDGAVPASCELLGGPCADLNFMVAASMHGVRTWVTRVRHPSAVNAADDAVSVRATTLAFLLSGDLSVNGGMRQDATLEPWDVAIFSPGESGIVSPVVGGAAEGARTAQGEPAPLVFFATFTPGDNTR